MCAQVSSYNQSEIGKKPFEKGAQKASQSIDYSDEFTIKQKEERQPDLNKKLPKIQPKVIPKTSNNNIFKMFLLVALGLGLLAFIIYLVVKNPGISKNYYSSDEESNAFAKLNLKSPLEEFLGQGNYRMACRMLYLKLLQDMVKMKMILWRNEKTNWDYYYESIKAEKVHKENLQNITQKFDLLWYGEVEPSLTEFNNFEQLIKNFKISN